MELHLVRHGQTYWNAERRIQGQLDSSLDEPGREQAHALAPTLDALGIGAVYCSTSDRTRETLALALTAPPEPVHYRDELREIDLGVWQGRLWSEIEREHPRQVAALREVRDDFDVEGAESYAALQRRGVAAIERIITESAAPIVLVVSHGALLKSVLAHYAGQPLSVLHTLPSLPNCAHSVLRARGDDREIVRVAGQAPGDDWSRAGRAG